MFNVMERGTHNKNNGLFTGKTINDSGMIRYTKTDNELLKIYLRLQILRQVA